MSGRADNDVSWSMFAEGWRSWVTTAAVTVMLALLGLGAFVATDAVLGGTVFRMACSRRG